MHPTRTVSENKQTEKPTWEFSCAFLRHLTLIIMRSTKTTRRFGQTVGWQTRKAIGNCSVNVCTKMKSIFQKYFIHFFLH